MHLLGLSDVSRDDILKIIDRSKSLTPPRFGAYRPDPSFSQALKGRPIGLLFFEPSTRTRASFELAVHHLGGHPLAIPLAQSSLVKGETHLDTCLNLWAMGVQGFVVRIKEASILDELAKHLEVPVINAGAGAKEHPTQGLLDIRTLQEALGCETFEGKRVAIIGDIDHSRVARSDVIGLKKLGCSLAVAGPQELLPPVHDVAFKDVDRYTKRDDALKDVDAVIVLRIQKERFKACDLDISRYIREWQINEEIVEKELKGVPILHPGPVVRGEELTDKVVDGPQSQILSQVRFGVAIRQSVLLHYCTSC